MFKACLSSSKLPDAFLFFKVEFFVHSIQILVEPVLSGHPWGMAKWPLSLKEIQFKEFDLQSWSDQSFDLK